MNGKKAIGWSDGIGKYNNAWWRGAYHMETRERLRVLGKVKREKMNRIIKHCVHGGDDGRDDGRETLNFLQIKANNSNYKDKCKTSIMMVII